MAANANSVNIEKERERYHHGDLRAALVTEGLRLLSESDADHLSLRAVARNIGVSATAVYRHFPDKGALLSALCVEGDRMLAQEQKLAQSTAGGGRAGFDEAGRAYVHFALSNPALFRLMMARLRMSGGRLENSGSAGIELLTDTVSAMMLDDAADEQKRIVALQGWAIVHGLSMMMLDGILPPDEALIDKVIRSPC